MSGRLIITGVDGSGRSCAAQDGPVTMQGATPYGAGLGGLDYSVLYAAPAAPRPSTGGGRTADPLDLAVPPGALRWTAIEYAPGTEFAMHHTDTVDFGVVVSGSVDLVLDDGPHPLGPGDTAVVTGVDHAWRVGPEGCRLNVLTIGVSPPSA